MIIDKRKNFFNIPSILPQLMFEFPSIPKSYISKLMEETPELNNIKSILETHMNEINNINSQNWVMDYYKVFPCTLSFDCESPLCVYYHSNSEKRRSPKFFDYCPKICPSAGNCIQLENCNHAHNMHEILYHPEIYQSAKCPYLETDFGCPCIFLCPFVHCLSSEDKVLEEFKEVLKKRDDVEMESNGVECYLKEKLEEYALLTSKANCKCGGGFISYIRVPCGHTACYLCYSGKICSICGENGNSIIMKENHKVLSLILRDNLEESSNGINCLTSFNTSLIAGSRDGIVREYNTVDKSLTSVYNGHVHWVNAVACTDSIFFSASSDSRIIAWRYNDPSPCQILNFHKDYVHTIKIHENFLISGGEDGHLVKTDLEFKPSHLYSFQTSIWHFDYQDNLGAIALGSKNFHILDFRAPKPETEIKGHNNIVRKLSISPSQTEILTSSSDGYIKLWDMRTRKVKENFHIHNTSIFAFKCYWDQNVFISGDKDGFVYKVQIDTHATEQICKESLPVLDVEEVMGEVWVSTSGSGLSSYCSMQEQRRICGRARYVQFEVSDNKKFVVLKTDSGNVDVMDVVKNKVERVEMEFKQAVEKVNTKKNCNSWFVVSLKLGCVCLDFVAGDCVSGFEIINNEQVYFIEVLFKELFYTILDLENTDRQSAFDKAWLVLKQHLSEKTEVFWMSQANTLFNNRITEIPIWIKEIIPDITKGLNSYN